MQRYFTSTLTACALAATVNAFAQEPAPGQPQPEKQQASKETLSGCVIEAKTTEGGTAYVLSNAEGGTAKMYLLVAAAAAPAAPDRPVGTTGSSESEWAANVNKKVEVTGPVQQPNAPPAEDGAAGAPKVLRPPTIQVESVKVIAETCK
jgi:hypothetical protein